MSIRFACSSCGKSYEVEDRWAGKRAKCKQCQASMEIPLAAAPAESVDDPYGLAETVDYSRRGTRKPEATEIDDESFTLPRRGSSPKRSQPSERQEFAPSPMLANMAWGFLVMGLAIFILPMFGFQLRKASKLPEGGQRALGVVLLVLSAIVFGVLQWRKRAAQTSRRDGGLSLGKIALMVGGAFLAFIGLLVLLAVLLPALRPGRSAAPATVADVGPVLPPGVPFPPAMPPGLAGPGVFVAPETNPIPSPGGAAAGARAVLSNGFAWQDPGPGLLREWNFRVDYRFEAGRPMPGMRYVWVVQSPNTRADQTQFTLGAEGTLDGGLMPRPGEAGPFETYLALETFGPGGPSKQVVSNTLPLATVNQPPPDSSPGRSPFPGPPGFAGPPGFPGPPGFAGPAPFPSVGPGSPPSPPGPPPRGRVGAEPGSGPAPALTGNYQTAIADLTQGDALKKRQAADWLARSEPLPEWRPQVLNGIEPLLTDTDLFARMAGSRALAKWADAGSVPSLIRLLDDENFVVRGESMKALGRLPDPRAAEALVNHFDEDRINAKRALTDMGPTAEPAIDKLLSHADWSTRKDGCEILETIGTRASLKPLQAAARDENALVRMFAGRAVQAIQKRGR